MAYIIKKEIDSNRASVLPAGEVILRGSSSICVHYVCYCENRIHIQQLVKNTKMQIFNTIM